MGMIVPVFVCLVMRNSFVLCKNERLIFTNFVLFYLIIIGSVFIYEYYLSYKLNSFDLNGDSVFSGLERTEELDKYFNLKMNDTGRTFAPVTGFLFTILHTFVFYFFLKIKQRKQAKKRGAK